MKYELTAIKKNTLLLQKQYPRRQKDKKKQKTKKKPNAWILQKGIDKKHSSGHLFV